MTNMNESNIYYIPSGYDSIHEIDVTNLKFVNISTVYGLKPFIVDKDGFYFNYKQEKISVKTGDVLLYSSLESDIRETLGLPEQTKYIILATNELKEFLDKKQEYYSKYNNDLQKAPQSEQTNKLS